MAINMMCMNSECKYYWEDNCTRNLQEERIQIGFQGVCETFEKGESDWYKEPRFLLEEDSVCFGCKYFFGGEDGCNPPNICIEGSLNSYSKITITKE